jgi:hypothetical protein
LLSRLTKALLVLTAFAPVLITYAFVLWRKGQIWPWGVTWIVVSGALTTICLLVLVEARRSLQKIACNIEEIRTADKEIVAFVLTYLAPLASIGQDSLDPWIVAFVAAFFLAVVWTSHAYHFNPLLSLIGFHFYEITDSSRVSYVLITRRNLRQAKHTATVVQLSEYILLELETRDA